MITNEKGQMPLPTNREHMTPTRWKKTSIATKKQSLKKKDKGQIPFPIDRASNDADKVKTGLHRYKKNRYKKAERSDSIPYS